MVYENITNQNLTQVTDLVSFANTTIDGWFGALILLMLGSIILLSMIFTGWDVKRSYSTSSFITFIAALFFRMLEWIQTEILITSIILVGMAVLWLVFDRN